MRVTLLRLTCVALLVCACGLPAQEGERLGVASQDVCAAGATVEGIDVARWQTTINWSQVKAAGKVFGIAQVGRGTSPDAYFNANWSGMKANGIIRGAYLRFFPAQSLQAQADMLINVAYAPGDLPPMVDIEDADGLPIATVAAKVQEMLAKVQAGTGRVPMIYTGYYFWKDNVQLTGFGANPLIIANYSSACPLIPAGWSKWTFHQYTSSGSVSGISGNVDLDKFNGTLAELQAFANGTGVPPQQNGTLTGAIYQKGNSADRVQGALVAVNGQTQTTGADGMYTFTVPAGTHTVSVSKPGFTSASVSRTVSVGATVWGSMNIDPTASTATLQGTVYAFDPANPANTSNVLPGATLTIGVQTVTTDALGAFKFVLAPGTYTATVSKDGYQSSSIARTLAAGATVKASVGLTAVGTSDKQAPDLTLAAPANGAQLELALVTVSGTATDNSGPVAKVSLVLNDAAPVLVDVTSGSFSRELRLKAGLNTLEVKAADGAGNVGSARVTATFNAGLRGTVTTGEGAPVGGARLELQDGGGKVLAFTQSGSDGLYRLDAPAAPLSGTLVTTAAGFVTDRRPVKVSEDARSVLDFELGSAGEAPRTLEFLNLPEGTRVDTETLKVFGEATGFSPTRVTVNGQPAESWAGGSGFFITVPLELGENVLTADAEAADGAHVTARVIVFRDAKAKTGCTASGGELSLLALGAAAARLLARRRA